MASKKHTNDVTELSKAYEENEIRLKGIVGFGIGLFFLIVITFGLMAALLHKLSQFHEDEQKATANPMGMSDKERLPPEPRLQLAPGFGVDSEQGRVNLELGAPADEYRELHAQWVDLWEHGQKDAKSGTVTVMPIDEAKDKLVESKPKAKADPQAEEYWKESRSYVSDASSGRVAGERRR
jgi:hypothetical protein